MVAIFTKKVSSLEVLHFPHTCILSRDREGAHFLLWSVYYWSTVVIWQFFLCGFNLLRSRRHCVQISQIRVWSVRNNATSDNWVLPIIWCPPVLWFPNFGHRRQKWNSYSIQPYSVSVEHNLWHLWWVGLWSRLNWCAATEHKLLRCWQESLCALHLAAELLFFGRAAYHSKEIIWEHYKLDVFVNMNSPISNKFLYM